MSITSNMDSVESHTSGKPQKNFAYLLHPEMYHPLSSLDIPPAFRSKLQTLSPEDTLESTLESLDGLLKDGHFLLAAHLAPVILISPLVKSTDQDTIFFLLYIRLACLELTGKTLLAAQEAKNLQDLSSGFYYIRSDEDSYSSTDESESTASQMRHIVPWQLRVLAIRLQSIGFGDSRRSVAGLYELGVEARKHISQKNIHKADKMLWKYRLEDLGVRVVNTLIEMGDLDTAQRSLANMKITSEATDGWISRIILLQLRIGDLEAAKSLSRSLSSKSNVIYPLLSMAEGRYDDAINEWRIVLDSTHESDKPFILQNLAVCLLYTNEVNQVRISPF